MSEDTSTPGPEERDDAAEPEGGLFVGGEFGYGDPAEDAHLTSAQEDGAVHEEEAQLADPDQSAATAAEAPESVTDPSGEQTLATRAGAGSFGGDVEGTSTEPAPGDRNEPV